MLLKCSPNVEKSIHHENLCKKPRLIFFIGGIPWPQNTFENFFNKRFLGIFSCFTLSPFEYILHSPTWCPPSPRDPIQLVGEETLFWGALVSKKVDRRSKSLMRTRLAHVGQWFLTEGHKSTLQVAFEQKRPPSALHNNGFPPQKFWPTNDFLKKSALKNSFGIHFVFEKVIVLHVSRGSDLWTVTFVVCRNYFISRVAKIIFPKKV